MQLRIFTVKRRFELYGPPFLPQSFSLSTDVCTAIPLQFRFCLVCKMIFAIPPWLEFAWHNHSPVLVTCAEITIHTLLPCPTHYTLAPWGRNPFLSNAMSHCAKWWWILDPRVLFLCWNGYAPYEAAVKGLIYHILQVEIFEQWCQITLLVLLIFVISGMLSGQGLYCILLQLLTILRGEVWLRRVVPCQMQSVWRVVSLHH